MDALHGAQGKDPRSKMALAAQLSECEVEHAVPLMHIVNALMDMPSLDAAQVEALLKRLYVVRLVTAEEYARLNGSGLRSMMPEGWDSIDVLARYKQAGIEFPDT